jgi:hypothetical protein
MDSGTWHGLTDKIREWAGNQEKSDNLEAIMLSLKLGDKATDNDGRETYWVAIRTIGSTMEGFPLFSKVLKVDHDPKLEFREDANYFVVSGAPSEVLPGILKRIKQNYNPNFIRSLGFSWRGSLRMRYAVEIASLYAIDQYQYQYDFIEVVYETDSYDEAQKMAKGIWEEEINAKLDEGRNPLNEKNQADEEPEHYYVYIGYYVS